MHRKLQKVKELNLEKTVVKKSTDVVGMKEGAIGRNF